MQAVSAYVTDAKKLEKCHSFFTPLWRLAFGEPHPREDYPYDFFPQMMTAQFLVSYIEEYDSNLQETAYKTFIFGGTINEGYSDANENKAFQSAQMVSITKILQTDYPDLGFDE